MTNEEQRKGTTMTAPQPTAYTEGHIKRDPATGAVAIRTIFPEDQGAQLAGMAWLVATKNIGARNAPTAEVAGWDDLPLPESGDPSGPGGPE